ncbi:MAG: hypothetical protein L2C94_003855 [Aigarchaeota archaeon]|nr:hypothetical protein [Candidatus Wolframiiraptor gerlachensis]
MRRITILEEEKAGEWDLMFEEEGKKLDVCPVCSAEIHEGVPVFECPFCGNKMHARCVQPWINERGTCPICKRPLSQKA